MTKKKTKKDEPQQYVILTRIKYRAFVEGVEPEYIDPHPEDPYHPDARRITLEHLSPKDQQLLIMRKVVAPDKEEVEIKETGDNHADNN